MRELTIGEVNHVAGGFSLGSTAVAQNALIGGAAYATVNILTGFRMTGEGFLGSMVGGAVGGGLARFGPTSAIVGGAAAQGITERVLNDLNRGVSRTEDALLEYY